MMPILVVINIALMLLAWGVVTFNRRAGLVDVIWSLSIALNVLIGAVVLDMAPGPVRLFLSSASGLWFLRLSWHLFRRYMAEDNEDTRYANMRRAMGKYQHLGFLLFFLFQAGLVLLFSYPMLKLLSIPAAQWQDSTGMWICIGGMVMLLAFIGETLADQQLYRFKQRPENRGKTMDQGLWKYSRHPNYFFEWLHWFAYPIIGIATGSYLLWIYPVLMWLFLYYITGIPFSEQQALKNRGDNYRMYQQKTSMFIPWPPKK